MATDVLDDAPPARPSEDVLVPAPPTARRRGWVWAAMGVGLAGVVVGSVVGYGTATHAEHFDGRILPSAVVAGVEVGGLTGEQALAAVEEAIAPQLERPVTVTWQDRSWSTSPAALGSTSDAEQAVAAAVDASANPSVLEHARMRWLGEQLEFTADVTVTHSPQGARAYVDAIAEEVNLSPVDAALDYSSGWVEVSQGRDGRVLDTATGGDALSEALVTGQDAVELVAHPVAPSVTPEDFDQILLVRQIEHKLYLYRDGEITHSWDVAVGTGDHPTPVGQYTVTARRHMPTWVNPSPTGWGADLPASIGPGVDNPLGVRAINWDAPAIRFHGTANLDSIGTDASKGCVRLTNDDVVELYDLVREGATIVSVRA